MKKFFLFVLLSAFCLPSFGQIRFIDENGEVYTMKLWEMVLFNNPPRL